MFFAQKIVYIFGNWNLFSVTFLPNWINERSTEQSFVFDTTSAFATSLSLSLVVLSVYHDLLFLSLAFTIFLSLSLSIWLFCFLWLNLSSYICSVSHYPSEMTFSFSLSSILRSNVILLSFPPLLYLSIMILSFFL